MQAITRQAFTQTLAQNGGYVEIDRIPEQLREQLRESGVSDEDLAEVAGEDRVIRSSAEWSNLFSRIDAAAGGDAVHARDSSGRPTPSARVFDALRAHVEENRARAEREGGLRFKGDRTLDQVAAGRRTLTEADSGDSVRRVQQALADLGFLDPERGVSGTYDATTSRAVERFQREVGLPESGDVDADTLGAMIAVAPPPGEVLVRSAEYDRLYAGGRLGVTIALGDGPGGDHESIRDVMRGLRAQGFHPVAAGDRARLNLTGDRFDPSASYFSRSFHDEKLGREVDVVVRLLLPSPDGAGARASLDRALGQDAVVLYAGRAPLSGPAGDRPAAGLRATFGNQRTDPGAIAARPDYQLLVLDGATADEHRDAARPRRGMTDTDVIATSAATPAPAHGAHLVRFLEGLTRRESNNSMLGAQSRIDRTTLQAFGLESAHSAAGPAYTESGFLNNGANRRERRAS